MTLPHAKRSLLQSTYTPVTTAGRADRSTGQSSKRAATKWGLVSMLAPRGDELAGGRLGLTADEVQAARHIGQALERWTDHDVEGAVQGLGRVDAAVLAGWAGKLVAARDAAAQETTAAFAHLAAAFDRATRARPPSPSTEMQGGELIPSSIPGRSILRRVTATPPAQPSPGAPAPRLLQGERISETFEAAPAPPPPLAARVRLDVTAEAILAWAASSDAHRAAGQELADSLAAFRLDPARTRAADVATALRQSVDRTRGAVQVYKAQLQVEPIGILNLERLTFIPDGIERGELVYSVPLAPGEEVHLTHKEWSNTTEEFESLVNDELEDYSETGVAEKVELIDSTTAQTQHSSNLSAGVTASGGYGPVTVTTSVNGSVADVASSTAQTSRNQAIATTRKASSRSKREHKTTFKVASASTVEDSAVRSFTNPFTDRAVRADYYQLIRKWRVDHYRYGTRLTYDLAIPEPGSDVMSRLREIAAVRATLDEEFGANGAQSSWARFDLAPSQITRNNYVELAAEYGASLSAPPAEYRWFTVYKTHRWDDTAAADQTEFFALTVDVPEDYEIDAVRRDRDYSHWNGEAYSFDWQSVDDFIGVYGTRSMIYQGKYLGALYVELRVRARLRDEVYDAWRLKSWNLLRDAAMARYTAKREVQKARLDLLLAGVGADDALSLRKLELDELMKAVLRFLFGPDFAFNPPGIPKDLYGNDEAVKNEQIWLGTLAWGEMIKFLHQAVEWENLLYFLYPYFWSHTSRWEEKKYLQHADPLHRAFLKAGSARVVLTIRPGFERAFLGLMENLSLTPLVDSHEYITIVEEMEAYAHTNYPGIPPANPELADTREHGVLIGSWYEYTPTSALDVAFGETMPTE